MTAAILLAAGALAAVTAQGQQFDLLLTGGHVLDPANQIDSVMDVAIAGGRIARVAKNIPPNAARKVVHLKGLWVTPGLIDVHTHVYGYVGSLFPDDTSLITGATTIVDVGGAGWRTFDDFKAKIIDVSQTRVLSFLNIVGQGMLGPDFESNVDDMDPEKTAAKIKQYPNLIAGIKTAHYARRGWTSVDRASRPVSSLASP